MHFAMRHEPNGVDLSFDIESQFEPNYLIDPRDDSTKTNNKLKFFS